MSDYDPKRNTSVAQEAAAAVISGELLIKEAAKRYRVKPSTIRSILFAREYHPAEVTEHTPPPKKRFCPACRKYYYTQWCVRCAALRSMDPEAAQKYLSDRAILEIGQHDQAKYRGPGVTKLG